MSVLLINQPFLKREIESIKYAKCVEVIQMIQRGKQSELCCDKILCC